MSSPPSPGPLRLIRETRDEEQPDPNASSKLKSYYADLRTTSKIPYNASLGVVLLPCLAVIVYVGGKQAVGALAGTLMVGVALEQLQITEGPLMSSWIGLVWLSAVFARSASLSLSFSGTWESVAFLVHGSIVLLCAAAWASLQAVWFQQLLPHLCIVFERLLFSLGGVCSAAFGTFLLSHLFGVRLAPFFLFFTLHIVFGELFVPQFSAFRLRDPTFRESEYYIQSYPESIVCIILYVFAPAIVHTIAFVPDAGTSLIPDRISEGLLLLCLPLLGIWWSWHRKPLWFLEDSFPSLLPKVRILCGLIPAAVGPLALSSRVLWRSFLEDVSLPFPMGHILLLFAAYGVSAVIVASFYSFSFLAPSSFSSKTAASVRFFYFVCAADIAAGAALTLGAPHYLWPVFVAFGVSFVWWLESRKSLPFGLMLLSSCLCLVWFLSTRLSFIEFHFNKAYNLPLENVLGLLTACFLAAFVLLEVWVSQRPVAICNAILVVYSGAFAFAEWLLAYGHDANVPLYGEIFTVASSAAGLYVSHASHYTLHRVSRGGTWMASAVWVSKLAPVFISHVLAPALASSNVSISAHDSPMMIIHLCTFLWALIPLALFWATPKALKPSRAAMHLAVVALTLVWAHSSFSAFADYSWFLAVWGAVALLVALRFFPSSFFGRTVSAVVFLSALIFAALDEILWIAIFVAGVIFVVFPPLRHMVVAHAAFGLLLALKFNVEVNGEDKIFLFGVVSTVAAVSFSVMAFRARNPPPIAAFVFAASSVASYVVAAREMHQASASLAVLAVFCVVEFSLALSQSVLSSMHAFGTSPSGRGVAEAQLLSRFDRDAKRVAASDAGLQQFSSAFAASSHRVGDAGAVLCFVGGCFLLLFHMHVSVLFILPLSSVLLAFGQERGWGRWPPVLACAVFFLTSSFWHLLHAMSFKNFFLFVLSLPSFGFLASSMVVGVPRGVFWVLMSLPGVLLFALFSDLSPDSVGLFCVAAAAVFVKWDATTSGGLVVGGGSSAAKKKTI